MTDGMYFFAARLQPWEIFNPSNWSNIPQFISLPTYRHFYCVSFFASANSTAEIVLTYPCLCDCLEVSLHVPDTKFGPPCMD